ncbi:MAG: phosphonate C-P lyase system protein PhnG [Meiothermus sp.]|nr:phosphonate C-P lyase system protein PhnG [Meiothermus sp.]
MSPAEAQGRWLGVLARAEAEALKEFVEGLLPALEPYGLEVLENRTGLVMLPATDTARGTRFLVGEVLVAEARVRLGGSEGYAACLGRDLEQALAIAILDAALQEGLEPGRIRAYVEQEAARQAEADAELARQVAATRVEMETF